MNLTLDFETFYSTKYSLKKLTTMAYVRGEEFQIHGVGIKINNNPVEYFHEHDVNDALQEIWNEDIRLICHNTKFDAFILAEKFNLYANFYYDTMSMSAGLYPGQAKNLDAVAKRLLNKEKGTELILSKGLKELPEDIAVALEDYCKKDVTLTYECFGKMLTEFPQLELELIDLHVRMFVEPKFKLNRKLVHEFLKTEEDKQKCTIQNSGYTRDIFASNPKFAQLLQSKNISVPKKISLKTGKEAYAFAKSDIAFQELQKQHPELSNIWKARLATKSTQARTRAKSFLAAADPHTDLMPVPLKYFGAITGRFSGTEKINLQNLGRNSSLRNALTAPKGYKVVYVDSANIEARVLAWISGQTNLLDNFRNGDDVYALFASKIYGHEINKKEHPTERFVGKVAVLGLGYGMGWEKFKNTLQAGTLGGEPVIISEKEAKAIVYRYRSMNGYIKRYWDAADLELYYMRQDNTYREWGPLIVKTEKIELPSGMHLKYPGLRVFGDTAEIGYNLTAPSDDEFDTHINTIRIYGRKLVENIIQSLSRNIVMEQTLEISKKYKVVLTVHDEVVCVVPVNEVETAYQYMVQVMTTSPSWAEDLPLDADGGFDDMYCKN